LLKAGLISLADLPAAALIVFARYLRLVRVIQRVYWLEPAGSKGVWGLDDFQFVPFLWGAAQFATESHAAATPSANPAPAGSMLPPPPRAPKAAPASVPSLSSLFDDAALLQSFTSPAFTVVRSPVPETAPPPETPDALMASLQGQQGYLFADALAYVSTSKTGAFRVHSPTLCSLASVPGWVLAVQGLCRMYGGEVLAKFPVMQHVLFGSLLRLDEGGQPEYLPEALRAPSDAESESAHVKGDRTTSLPPLDVILHVFPIPPESTTAGVTRYRQ
jgi:serine/threonine-protein phosphatase 2A activator